MSKYASALSLKKFVVNNIQFKRNEKFCNNENVNLDFKIKKHIEYNDNIMNVKLATFIFSNPAENNFPFEMIVEIEGIFEIIGENSINWEPNAIAILYPYIRSIVSTYTSVANVFPIILPIININTFLQDEE